MSKTVQVITCRRNTIYVDERRITHRGTKWGVRRTLCRFDCDQDDVVQECLERGFTDHVRAIDTEPHIFRKAKGDPP